MVRAWLLQLPVLLQKKPVRESTQRQTSCSSSGSLSPSSQAAHAPKAPGGREWKYIASEKTTSKHEPHDRGNEGLE